MFGRTNRPSPDAIEVIIGPRATFSGTLRCDASVRIDGGVEAGHIETPANVILTETARVECNITAKNVSIRGTFRGIIRAQRVELLRGSQVYGALHVTSFFMDDGVQMHAELDIQSEQQERGEPERPKANPLQPKRAASIPVVDPLAEEPKKQNERTE